MKILIVDDEPLIAMDLYNNLIEMGYDAIKPVFCSDNALNEAIINKPDLVLMDITLNENRRHRNSNTDSKRNKSPCNLSYCP